MGKPLSWKWKLTVAGVGLSIFLAGYMFTSSCHEFVLGRMNQAFNDTPEDERRDSPWASRYLTWAYFRSTICGEKNNGYAMYRDFCGLPKDMLAHDAYFSKDPKVLKYKLGTGKASPGWQKGWGLLHPEAPEAYYEYLCLMETHEVGATTGREAKIYYMLFYTMHMKYSPGHKPHPKFHKYWEKVMQKILNGRVGTEGLIDYDPKAVKAEKWVEPK